MVVNKLVLLKKIKLSLINNYNLLTEQNKTKVFCIGFNKTGTTSLLYALKEHRLVFGNFGQGERLVTSYLRGDFNKIVSYCRFGSAFKDVPLSLPYTYRYLDKVYPNSKFILTIRNSPEQWYDSITKFHTKTFAKGERIPTYDDLISCGYCYQGWAWHYIKACFGTPKEDPYNKDILIKKYNEHIIFVTKFFKNDPNKLYILNVSNADSYIKMCEFLNLKPIYEVFPWKNKTIDKKVL